MEAIVNLVPPLTESDLVEAEQFAAGCDLAPNAAIRIKRLAAAYRQLSVARDCLAAELESVNKALEPLGGYLLESREKTIKRAAIEVDDLHKLVAYGCTIQRGSKPSDELFVIVDVDGIVIAGGPTVNAAMHRGVYKIETGEDPALICEHGSLIGDWCEPCNAAYKQAIRENAGECINCHQVGDDCKCGEG